MQENLDYININKEAWNNKTSVHIASPFYNIAAFKAGATSLNDIELNLLGNIKGKSILHLQCHFGQDTIALNRLGATTVGVDLSDKAIAYAKQLAEETNSTAQFICCNIYDLPEHLDRHFDIVYTSYGTIGWLPDLDKWAQIIANYLKPGGQFIFVEFHPLVWMYDDHFDKIAYSYFMQEPIIETEDGSYADKSADIKQTNITWNHSLSEVMSCLLKNNLSLKAFNEYDYSPYNVFHNMVEYEPKKYRIGHIYHTIPLVYSIIAEK